MYKNSNRNSGRYNPRQNQGDRPRRAPLPEGFSLFYIAISCTGEIDDKINELKNYMEDNFGCRAAKKSPAHITIVPPFRAEDELISELAHFVTEYNMGLVPFEIQLSGYGQFSDRVLFVDVEKPHELLTSLEVECMNEFGQKFPGIIFGMKPEFNPHVTIATRDIPEGALAQAKQFFETNHPFNMDFQAKALTLFRLDKGWWKQVNE